MAKTANKPATVKNVREIVNEVVGDASEVILKGVQKMFDEQNRINDKKFATKEELKREVYAVREDLKREISWVRDDIRGLKADLSDVPSRKEFNRLKEKVDSFGTME